MLAEDGPITLGIHGVTLIVNTGLLVAFLKVGRPFLREYRIYSRLKERMNTLWHRHCADTGELFIPLENGNSHHD